MHFLLLNQTFYPDELATSQQLLDLAKVLIGRGHKVSVIADFRSYENRKKHYSFFENHEGIEIHRVFSTGFGKKNFYLRIVDALTFDFFLLLKLLFFPAPDYVVSFTSPPLIGFLGVLYSKLKGCKSIAWLMDVNPDIAITVGFLKEQSFITRVLRKVHKFSMQNSKYIVVLDRWMKKKIEDLSIPAQKLIIVHPWSVVHSKETKPSDFSDSVFRKEYGLEGKFIVIYSGNHSIVHPVDTLLEAALRLKDKKDIVFAFVGFGVRTQDVTDFKAKHSLENIIQLPLQSREVYGDMLRTCNLQTIIMGKDLSGLLHPSKIYSILATGRPYLFIGPQNSHVTDILGVLPYGFKAEHGDVNSVLSAIERVKNYSSEDYQLVYEKNIPYVRENFSIEKSLKQFLEKVSYRHEEPTAIATPSKAQDIHQA